MDGELRSPAWKYLKRFEDRLGVAFILFLALMYWITRELEKRHINRGAVSATIVAIVIAAIVISFWLMRRNQKRAIARFNLKCPACGYTPRPSEIAATEAMRECFRCYERLPRR